MFPFRTVKVDKRNGLALKYLMAASPLSTLAKKLIHIFYRYSVNLIYLCCILDALTLRYGHSGPNAAIFIIDTFFKFLFFFIMNIYVSNLSYNLSDSDLQELFQPYGSITSAKVITDHDTGRSRGFGFVEMSNKDEAMNALTELNNAEVDGKVINVNEARPKSDKPRSYDSGGYNKSRNRW